MAHADEISSRCIRFCHKAEPDADEVFSLQTLMLMKSSDADVMLMNFSDADAKAGADQVFMSRSNQLVLPRSGLQTSVFRS